MGTQEQILNKLEGGFQACEQCAIVGTTLNAAPVMQKNASRNSIVLSAGLSNTGVIYLGFSRSVSATNFFMTLSAGDWIALDDFRGEIYAIASVASQTLGMGEW